MKTYNTNPYFDDFDSTKDFHQILFNPGVSVQSRELTQMQTILRDQILKFGNSIYKNGSVVSPGNVISELSVPFIKISGLTGTTNYNSFLNKTIANQNGNIVAHVKHIEGGTNADPTTLYLSYISGGGVGNNTFADGDTISLSTNSSIYATLLDTDSTGVGSLVYINQGTYYVNGTFVNVKKQQIVLEKYSTTPTFNVLLQISENIVTSDDDQTLLDPAQGENNYAAPGADRVKIELTLTKLPIDATINANYILLMQIVNGEIKELSKYQQYSELEKSIARRTYDESGDYRVSGFDVQVLENKRTNFNSGFAIDGDLSKLTYQISSGKGYIDGFELSEFDQHITVDKARTAAHIKTKSIGAITSSGSYLYISTPNKLPNIRLHETISLYTNNSTTTKVADLNVIGVEYFSGDVGSGRGVYKLFYHDLKLSTGQEFTNGAYLFLGGVQFAKVLTKYSVGSISDYSIFDEDTVISSGTRSSTVWYFNLIDSTVYAYKQSSTADMPKVGDVVKNGTKTANIIGSTSRETTNKIPVIDVGVTSIESVSNNGIYDVSYSVWENFQGVTANSGKFTLTTADGIFDSGALAFSAVGDDYSENISFGIAENTINFERSSLPDGTVIYVCARIIKSTKPPKVKTLVTTTISAAIADSISLGKCDVYSVSSIITNEGIDVTSNYYVDTGQRDYFYGLGSINKKHGTSVTGTTLSITYSYFNHSGASDYFSVDSYASLGSTYLDTIPNYITSTGEVYNLNRCIDFRPINTTSGQFSSVVGEYSANIVSGTFVRSSIGYFIPRIDTIYLDKSNGVVVKTGIPNDIPTEPSIPDSSLKIATVYIPAYTKSVDTVKITPSKNVRYTMSDIHVLEDRITNLEFFSTLTATEGDLLKYTVTDPSGLNMFKVGYLVDNFTNQTLICDYYNLLNRCTINNKSLSSAIETHDTQLEIKTLPAGYKIIDNQVMLDYTEVPLISQKTSTRITNLNPFMVFSWEGSMTIQPNYDSWVEVENLPEIFVNKTDTITVTNSDRSFFDSVILPTLTVATSPTINVPVNSATNQLANTFADSLNLSTLTTATTTNIGTVNPSDIGLNITT